MSEHSVAVQRWDRVEVGEPVPGEVPAVTPSVPVAGACPPTSARLLNHLTIPAYVNVPEPTCEELQDGSAYGGPIGIEGQQRASLGRRT